MSYSITTAKGELEAMLHGTTLNQVQNIYGVFNRAARQLLLDIDPQETIRISQLSQQVFKGVWKYPVASDLKGISIIDVRPQGKRYPYDRYLQQYSQEFDIFKDWSNYPSVAFEFDSGDKTIKIANPTLPAPVVINNCDSVTSNGTWTAGAGVASLVQDTVKSYNGFPSLGFNATANSATLYNSTMNAIDLTNYQGKSTNFLPIYMPTGANYTSVELRWGTGSGDYWTLTKTAQYDGTAFQNGWNLIGYEWTASTTSIGTPSYSAVNYIDIIITKTGGAENGLAISNITCQLGTILESVYYSKYLFSNASTGVWQETVLTDSDLINLDTESYNLFLYQCAFLCVQQALGQDAGYDTNIFLNKYDEGISKYKKRYPSQTQKPKTTYYKLPDNRYDKYTGWFYR